jgi:3-phenylpropionate/cinnamic acid dioxygenase small subunit
MPREAPDPAQVVEILQLYALYGHVMDDRDWSRLAEVFTPDCVFDATAMGVPLMEGLKAVAEVSASSPLAPVAHHVTNVLVEQVDADRAVVRAKAIGIYAKGRAFSGDYRDELRRTDDGWRIDRRVNRALA